MFRKFLITMLILGGSSFAQDTNLKSGMLLSDSAEGSYHVYLSDDKKILFGFRFFNNPKNKLIDEFFEDTGRNAGHLEIDGKSYECLPKNEDENFFKCGYSDGSEEKIKILSEGRYCLIKESECVKLNEVYSTSVLSTISKKKLYENGEFGGIDTISTIIAYPNETLEYERIWLDHIKLPSEEFSVWGTNCNYAMEDRRVLWKNEDMLVYRDVSLASYCGNPYPTKKYKTFINGKLLNFDDVVKDEEMLRLIAQESVNKRYSEYLSNKDINITIKSFNKEEAPFMIGEYLYINDSSFVGSNWADHVVYRIHYNDVKDVLKDDMLRYFSIDK